MAQGLIPLGAVPARESSAHVGETGYVERAFLECQRYMTLLRHVSALPCRSALTNEQIPAVEAKDRKLKLR